MNWNGILIGAGSFLIIGILHPVIIKLEYHLGKEIWPLFLAGGIICNFFSLLTTNQICSVLLAVLGFSLFWSIRELYEQEARVKKGWFPAKPSNKNKETNITASDS